MPAVFFFSYDFRTNLDAPGYQHAVLTWDANVMVAT